MNRLTHTYKQGEEPYSFPCFQVIDLSLDEDFLNGSTFNNGNPPIEGMDPIDDSENWG